VELEKCSQSKLLPGRPVQLRDGHFFLKPVEGFRGIVIQTAEAVPDVLFPEFIGGHREDELRMEFIVLEKSTKRLVHLEIGSCLFGAFFGGLVGVRAVGCIVCGLVGCIVLQPKLLLPNVLKGTSKIEAVLGRQKELRGVLYL
jgi:hypothetical protein